MESSIKKFYLASFLGGLSFTNGILILYYRNIGFSYTQIFTLSIIYEILTFLLEIPTGILADLWSRKWVITIGHAISGFSFLVVLTAPTSFITFVIWAILSAICTALNSGTMTAIIFDTLKNENREAEYLRVQSNITILILFSQTISIICGGWIANSLGFQYTLILSALSGISQACILAGVKEPDSFKDRVIHKQKNAFCNIFGNSFQHFKISLYHLYKNKYVRLISIFCILGFVTCSIFNNILQPLIAISGLNSYIEVSLIIAGINLLTMISIYFAQKTKGILTKRSTLLILFISIACMFFAVNSIHSFGLIFILAGLNILLEIYQLITDNKMNLLIPSKNRATILSTQNQINSLTYSFLALFIGNSIDKEGMNIATNILGFCFLIIALFYFAQKETE